MQVVAGVLRRPGWPDGGPAGVLCIHKGGWRKGRRVAFPRFRQPSRGRESVWLTSGAIPVVGKRHVLLPRIGPDGVIGVDAGVRNLAVP